MSISRRELFRILAGAGIAATLQPGETLADIIADTAEPTVKKPAGISQPQVWRMGYLNANGVAENNEQQELAEVTVNQNSAT